LTCWKLSTIPRTSGYHEKIAKQARPAARNAYASRLSAALRRRRVADWDGDAAGGTALT
jgi:hypothetical protein